MAEKLNLTTPKTYPTTSDWRVDCLTLDWGNGIITIRLKGTNGEVLTHIYDGSVAPALMIALNKANLTTNSLHKRILDRLVADGVLAGTVTGTPD